MTKHTLGGILNDEVVEGAETRGDFVHSRNALTRACTLCLAGCRLGHVCGRLLRLLLVARVCSTRLVLIDKLLLLPFVRLSLLLLPLSFLLIG